MDKIIVKGKLVSIEGYEHCSGGNTTTIELSPPSQEEISKLKDEGEVLVRARMHKERQGIPNRVYLPKEDVYITTLDIVAILSQPQQEFCECEEPQECAKCGYEHKPWCLFCGKPIKNEENDK